MNLLLIDLSSIVHAQFHVSGNDPNPDATSIASLARVHALASGQPHVGICVEGGRSFRKDIDPTYKANRPEVNAALVHQMGIVIDTLRADGFPVWRCEGCEADDVIASAVKASEAFAVPVSNGEVSGESPVTVTIATSDKDLLQLVSERVSVKSLKDGSLIDPAAVKAKLGVDPEQVRDWLTLVGDSSDNIKGCEKVGAKTATELLRKYGTLEDILARPITDFTPALGANLRTFGTPVDGQSPAMRARALVTMRTDLPVPIAEAFAERKAADVATFTGDDMEETSAASAAASVPGDGGQPSVPKGEASGAYQPPPQASAAQPQQTSKLVAISDPFANLLNQPARLTEFDTAFEPQTYPQAKAVASDMFAAKLFNGYGSPSAVLAVILMGRELGLSVGASLRAFHIIDGKPAMSADLIRALVLKSPLCEYFRCTERTPNQATFVTKRKGEPEMTLTYTLAEGRLAWQKDQKAWDASAWGKRPANMVTKTAAATLARLVYPDITMGLYCPEEISGEERV